MTRRKATAVVEQDAPVVENVPTYDLGEFEVTPYEERRYKAVYFGIREMYGQVCKNSAPGFDWEAFNTKFEGCFGLAEETKHSLDELEKFASTYFNKNLDEVIEYNRKSLNRRKASTTEMPKPKIASFVEEIPY